MKNSKQLAKKAISGADAAVEVQQLDDDTLLIVAKVGDATHEHRITLGAEDEPFNQDEQTASNELNEKIAYAVEMADGKDRRGKLLERLLRP